MNAMSPPDSWALSANAEPLSAVAVMLRPSPGLIRFPTTSPIASAMVDITRK
ncbi:Uncharacterised protein [Mycobacteroides abscessus subsp. abscessus]|nr:Uncharacterised protein [Mycobacteroides abscessus subsp. abscessus]